MATFTTFDILGENIAEKVHDFASDQFVVALCAAANAPVASNSVLGDLTQISYTNLSSRNLTTSSSSSSSGLYKLVLADLVLTASSGAVAGFRYVVVYNDTPTSPADPLIGFYDYGSDLVLNDGDSLTINFVEANGIIQIQT